MEYLGVVISFLPDKGYGFIKGDDGNDYHFKRRDVLGELLPVTSTRVAFDAQATSRGYSATKVIVRGQALTTWADPESFVVSEQDGVPGLGILYVYSSPCWTTATLHGQARQQLVDIAKSYGANGILQLRVTAVNPKGTLHMEGTMVYLQQEVSTWNEDDVRQAEERVQAAKDFAAHAEAINAKTVVDINPILWAGKTIKMAGQLIGWVRERTAK